MPSTTLVTTLLSLTLLTVVGCDQGEPDPMLEATDSDSAARAYQDVLATEHLAELSFDEGDIDTHMSLWAEGRLDFVSPFGSFTAPDDYEGWITGFYEYTQEQGGTRHFVLNPIVTFDEDGDEAEVTAYLHVINRTDGSFMGSSVIVDRLVETPEGWRFTYRSVEPDQEY